MVEQDDFEVLQFVPSKLPFGGTEEQKARTNFHYILQDAKLDEIYESVTYKEPKALLITLRMFLKTLGIVCLP